MGSMTSTSVVRTMSVISACSQPRVRRSTESRIFASLAGEAPNWA
jgi:hypothetical protein